MPSFLLSFPGKFKVWAFLCPWYTNAGFVMCKAGKTFQQYYAFGFRGLLTWGSGVRICLAYRFEYGIKFPRVKGWLCSFGYSFFFYVSGYSLIYTFLEPQLVWGYILIVRCYCIWYKVLEPQHLWGYSLLLRVMKNQQTVLEPQHLWGNTIITGIIR